MRPPCAGITKRGQPCRRQTTDDRVFCPVHLPRHHDFADVQAIADGLRDLGMLKPGERVTMLHVRRECPALKDVTRGCRCGTDVQLAYPEWNELRWVKPVQAAT